ncbi:hypothetical protein [Microvirga pudoricolor]|uniref:hypothetical protein n=1 Tax=Microvirga pudoricolor TaxID=2778729 RepID=UPI0019523D5D|nr:hypothetical protein [Microvirga pudoricolor]MBM6595464.1 hypothetical protein [Microvirga pudoricolor]
MKKSRALLGAMALIASGLPVQGTFAQGFSCKSATDAGKDAPALTGLIDQRTGRTSDARVAALVQQYQSNGIGSGDIVNRLVNGYCVNVAGIGGLSDRQKAELTRQFARQVTGYVYADASLGPISILVDVPLSQEMLDRVDASASAKGVSQGQWIRDAVEKALTAN